MSENFIKRVHTQQLATVTLNAYLEWNGPARLWRSYPQWTVPYLGGLDISLPRPPRGRVIEHIYYIG